MPRKSAKSLSPKKPKKIKAEKPVLPTPDWIVPDAESGLLDVFTLFERKNKYDRGQSEISVTQLLASPQEIAITMAHADEIAANVELNAFAIMGKALHKVLEDSDPPDSITEKRIFSMILGIQASGQADRIRKNKDGSFSVIDYKVTSIWSMKNGPHIEWVNQLNMLAYLLRKQYKITIRDLLVCAFFRDFSKARAPVYAPRAIITVKIPLWSYEEQERYITGRMSLHRKALADLKARKAVSPCTPEETWDTDRAEEYMKANPTAEYIMDAPKKCDLYCVAKPWCAQFKAYNGGKTFGKDVLHEDAKKEPQLVGALPSAGETSPVQPVRRGPGRPRRVVVNGV